MARREEEDRQRVLKEMQTLAASIGLTVEEVLESEPKKRGRRPRVKKAQG